MLARRMLDFPGLGWRNPFAEMERMKRQMDALSEMFYPGAPSNLFTSAGVFPLINLTEDSNNYYIRAELPGLKASDLDIQVTGRSLTLTGERKIPSEGEHVRYHRRERDSGQFSRIIGLPGDIDAERVEAKMLNGLLTVTIPKSAAAQPRRIAVK